MPAPTSPEIIDLSNFLNGLQRRLGGVTSEKFRNANGVSMKLMNFRRFDPKYEGSGLSRGNKDEREVWRLYSENPDELEKVVGSIRSIVDGTSDVLPTRIPDEDEEEAEEGRLLTRVHRYRERDRKIVANKKQKVLKETKRLACDVCGFDFQERYGKRGEGYIECHHTKPVSELDAHSKTKLSDLALVCSNCHKMIHRRKPWLSIAAARNLLK